MIQIQMICHFDVEGKIKPMRFQYQDNDENKAININRVIDMTKTKSGQILFKCLSIIEDFERNYTVIFNIDTCKWYLKMGSQ